MISQNKQGGYVNISTVDKTKRKQKRFDLLDFLLLFFVESKLNSLRQQFHTLIKYWH